MYCSVSSWSGSAPFNKVGEGLCNSALSSGMKITTSQLSPTGLTLYVGGAFYTRAWSGRESDFVKINNLAFYNSTSGTWSPLKGQLTCDWTRVTVMAMAWDERDKKLYIGGKFNGIDSANIPAGLAVYQEGGGRVTAMKGGGVTLRDEGMDGVVSSLQFDDRARVLYVQGTFERLTMGKMLCRDIAMYDVERDEWTCLEDKTGRFGVEAGMEGDMLLTRWGLMVAGRVRGEGWRDMEVRRWREGEKEGREEGGSEGTDSGFVLTHLDLPSLRSLNTCSSLRGDPLPHRRTLMLWRFGGGRGEGGRGGRGVGEGGG